MQKGQDFERVRQLPDDAKEIPGFAGYYATLQGEIFSTVRFKGVRRLRAWKRKGGYLQVEIRGKKPRIHQLVMATFGTPSPHKGSILRHRDGNPGNNHFGNLIWGTPQENMDDKKIHGTQQYGSQLYNAKLTEDAVREARREWIPREIPLKTLADKYGVAPRTLHKAIRGEAWRHVV